MILMTKTLFPTSSKSAEKSVPEKFGFSPWLFPSSGVSITILKTVYSSSQVAADLNHPQAAYSLANGKSPVVSEISSTAG